MTKVVVLRRAEADLDDIIKNLVQVAGPTVAGRYAEDFARLIGNLGKFPEMGARRPAVGERIRSHSVSPYMVFYRFDADTDTVKFPRVLHERRDITKRLLSS